ncbi:MAG: PQQ-dependent sugar dehydrogenase [Microgenomates group bacterium]
MNKKLWILVAVFVLIFIVHSLYFLRYQTDAPSDWKTEKSTVGVQTTTIPVQQETEIVAQDLHIPWDIAFLPDGRMLVTERSGKLLLVGAETKTIQEIEGVMHKGEGGLLGIAVHPQFEKNNYIYLYSTTLDNGDISNRVERYTLIKDVLGQRKVILSGIKGSSNHDGGQLVFGPDGYLYITTGDAENPDLAQDKNSLNGKILRIKDDGTIPTDNPFKNAVYSMGHRNPQGLAWDANGTLWETEHGPSGLQTGYDEINRIEKGKNYGWPLIRGDEKRYGLTSPVLQSGGRDTWAPAGLAYRNGSLYFTGLRGEALYEAKINKDNTINLTAHYKKEFGRLRAITLGPDGSLYISTSNRDGRGRAKNGDDKVIKFSIE